MLSQEKRKHVLRGRLLREGSQEKPLLVGDCLQGRGAPAEAIGLAKEVRVEVQILGRDENYSVGTSKEQSQAQCSPDPTLITHRWGVALDTPVPDRNHRAPALCSCQRDQTASTRQSTLPPCTCRLPAPHDTPREPSNSHRHLQALSRSPSPVLRAGGGGAASPPRQPGCSVPREWEAALLFSCQPSLEKPALQPLPLISLTS